MKNYIEAFMQNNEMNVGDLFNIENEEDEFFFSKDFHLINNTRVIRRKKTIKHINSLLIMILSSKLEISKIKNPRNVYSTLLMRNYIG